MQLVHENPEFRYVLRGINEAGVLVNQQRLSQSFLVTPQQLLENWRPTSIADLRAEDFNEALALQPEVILLGTGERQQFPEASILAAVMGRGVGLEVMNSAAAARTFNVLAGEQRRVLAAFLLAG